MTDSGMADLISRAAAIKGLLSMCPEKTEPGSFDEYGVTVLCGAVDVVIKGLPAVDAVPVVHARWIDYKDDHQCSACKEHTIFDAYAWKAIQFEFCPWCGAKMDGEWRDSE